MLDYAILFVSGVLSIALVMNLCRLLLGPNAPDRILALDTMCINSIALILVYGMHSGSPLYFEAALLIAMLGFVSSVAFAKYRLRGDIIE
ncbi:MAG: K+/H+ antiporter subunit F [Glaciecola sp.]|jgi:multicomponent K+:H+ antiporter subunit F|uniref:K+/H+ antiporter subunit F n=1 Tax=Glaciecola sp. HTCC2999 TaxID=455436 RepID=UPI0000E0E14B|nr:K+/H+ antiporter subunit F [Glaciecola sp. HTCC2999]MCH1414627.1 K+/H+ antiporter subunit F [Glaciecola sp.]